MYCIVASGKRRLRLVAALLMVCAQGTLAQAQEAQDVPWDNPTTALQMQRAIDRALTTKRIPGASVSVRQGDLRWTSNAGVANLADGAAPTAETYFGYRSVTKSFVTTVVLQLADEGRINLDDPIGDYVSGVPSGDVITIRQLAQMRSGLFNYTASPDFGPELVADPGRDWTPQELLAFAFVEPLQFAPGTSYEYSNTNTVLLGELIKATTGNDWSVEVERRLSRKLGLSSVEYQGPDAMPTPNAVGYIDYNDGTPPESLAAFNTTGAGASGGLIGVIGDVERWGEAVGSGELLSRREFVERLKSFGSTASDPESPEYDSYGFGMGEIAGFIGHTGNGLGFEALVMYDRANDRTISILINSSNFDDPDAPAHLFRELLGILGWTGPDNQIQVAADGTRETVEAGTVWTGLISGPFLTRAAVYADNGGAATANGRVTLAPIQDYVPAIYVGDGSVTLGHGGDITASFGGDGAFLATTTGTASLSLTDVSIRMSGDEISGIGIDARDNAVAELDRVSITGTALAGLHAGGGAPATIRGVGVDIDLARGDGVWVEANGVVDLVDSRIRLSGNGVGLHVSGDDGAARMLGTNLSVETVASGSYGVLAQGGGASVGLAGGSVMTHGADAHAIVLGQGARVDLDGVSVSAFGTSAASVAAFSVDASSETRSASLSLTNSTLSAASGTVVVAEGTGLALTASGSRLVGAITRSPDARVDLTLTDGSAWELPAAGLGVRSKVDDLVNRASTIAFASPVGGSHQSLTVGNYAATNGTLVMNAALKGAGAADRLIIDGGLASGHTRVLVAPTGDGGLTTGDGIRLIETVNGGETAPTAFTLGSRVASGALEYGLYRGGALGREDWFLRSTHGGRTGPGALPNLRPEVAVDTALPAIASQYGLAILGTRDERVAARAPGDQSAAWGRVFGQTGSRGGGGDDAAARLDRFERDGPSYDVDLAGFQAGYDHRLSQPGDTVQNLIGFYVGAGHARGSVDAVYGGSAGTVSMDAYSLGAYWNHTRAGGLHIDAVLQGTFYDQASARSSLGETLETDGFGVIGSLEAGYRFDLGAGWAIEPQAQLVYQNLSFEDGADRYGLVDYGAGNDVFGRIGGRVSRGWSLENGQALTGWARANLWQAFGDGPEVTFAGPSGGNPMSFDAGLGGTRVQVGLGASMVMSDRVELVASGDYDVRVDEDAGHAFGGRLGLTVRW
ncbi:autotransporter outer membrane beta-barrel domain-containing protein [Acuticoccus sp. M5D2P5]|uniref:autotransporter outer membrane beta-barrel domain-containing protein n=1 Tax=Acuticoccus kalidii TaxID=2910977 RepID=UPI001F42882D|nr:autotransporter outer membrane beta-barrel domain-containing protein [Acuticoccus kalidii]MCF3934046.1 autotransporter outer membrane beta-barrel domain-containing protein [Acuticoccus kalidii]